MGSIANGGREGIRTPGLLIANQATILIRHGAATVQPFRLPSKLGNLGDREKTGLGFSLSPWLSHRCGHSEPNSLGAREPKSSRCVCCLRRQKGCGTAVKKV